MRRISACALVVLVVAAVAGATPAGAVTTGPVDHYLSDTGDEGNGAYDAGEQIITSANASRKSWLSGTNEESATEDTPGSVRI